MNLKKLILTTTLALTLGLGACGTPVTPSTSTSESTSEQPSESTSTSSSSEIPAVSRIKIDAPATILVGEEVDLDEYVTVEGGEGPKVYEVEVPTTSVDKVTVDGHKITALVEGEISVTIKAGAKTAKFSTNALSALKAAWTEMTSGLTTEWALHELYQGQVYANSVVHRSDYTLFDGWDQDAEGNTLKGGFLLAQNGNTYQYVLNAEGEIEVDGTIQSQFGNYYCNMQWCLSPSDFTSHKQVDSATGEEFEYLVMTDDVPCVQYSNQFSSQIEFFMYTCALALNANYYFSQLVVQPAQLQGADGSAYDTFAIQAYINAAADDSIAQVITYILETRKEVSEIKVVRDYIDGGNAPAAVDATPLATTFNTIAAAGNYTMQVRAGWYNTPNTELSSQSTAPIADPLGEEFPAFHHNNFVVGDEMVYVDETGSQTITYGANVSGVKIEQTLPRVEGYKIDGETVYTYSNEVIDPETQEATLTTTFTGSVTPATVQTYLGAYTLAPLTALTGDHIKVLGYLTSGAAKQWAVECVPLFQVVTNASYLAYFAQYLLANGWQNDMTGYIDTIVLETGTGVTLCNFSLAWDNGQYYVIDVIIAKVGTTTVTHPEYTLAPAE